MHSILKLKIPVIKGWKLIFILVWIRYTILRWVEILLNRIPGMTYITPYLFYALLIIVAFVSINEIVKSFRISDFLLIAALLILWFVSKATHIEMLSYYDQYQATFYDCLLYLIVGKKTAENIDDQFIHSIYVCSIMGLCVTAVNYLYFTVTGVYSSNAEQMDLAYKVLPSILCIIGYKFGEHNKQYLLTVFSALLLLFLGTRGPILITIIYIAVLLFGVSNRKGHRVVIIISALVIIALDYAFDFISVVLAFLASLAISAGFSSRIMTSVLSGSFLYRDNRNEILDMLREKIGIRGYGLFSDRYYTIGIWGSIEGRYAHNVLYELWMNFGLIIGTVIIGLLLFVFLRSVFNNKLSYSVKFLALILIHCGFVKLFLSGSWITDQSFYLCLGFCLTAYNMRMLSNDSEINTV